MPRPDLDPALIVLIGVAGAGKSTLAAQWRPSQVLSLDAYRGIVSDDENDQEATADAVMVLHAVLDARLRRNLVTVVDATNVSPDARRPLLDLATAHHMSATAIVVDTPLPLCQTRNAGRPGPRGSARWGRRVPADVVEEQHRQLRESIPHLCEEGFAKVIIYSQHRDDERPYPVQF
ncbi:MAG TPA: AAA family ATPase [Actinoallomurus sp.]|nr:AAA family ATPase [Actinoallomurus sp.]